MTAELNYRPPAFRPAQRAATSGIYTVLHRDHRSDHDVIVLGGEEFPECYACGDAVRFYLVQEIRHVTHDFDFAGPRFQLLRMPPKRR